MNSYLLLRDNRKSGPFTAEELSAMGLKPYDLVWVEGKSAAWRYPGEIEELKPFAPAVEEQPYDRFYKKPVPQSPSALTHRSVSDPTYRSVSDSDPDQSSDSNSTSDPAHRSDSAKGRIYIRIPQSSSSKTISGSGSNRPGKATTSNPLPDKAFNATTYSNNSEESLSSGSNSPVNYLQQTGATPSVAFGLPFPERATSVELKKDHTRVEKNSLNRLLPLWITGMVILAGLSVFLFINYRQQNKRLNQLSNLVLDMQQAQPPVQSPFNKNVAALLPDIKDPSIVHALKDSAGVNEGSTTPLEVSTQKMTVPTKKNPAKKSPVSKDSASKKQVASSDSDLLITHKAEPAPLMEKPSESAIRNALELSANDYKIGLFGGITNLELTLTNNSPVDLEKVIVHIEYLGPDEKVLREQTASFHDLQAGKSFTEKLPKSGRGVSVRFRIKSVVPV